MSSEPVKRDLPLWLRLVLIFVLSLALALVVVEAIARQVAQCSGRPVWIKGSSDPEAPPWER